MRFGHTRKPDSRRSERWLLAVAGTRKRGLRCFGLSEGVSGDGCILSASMRLTEVVAENKRILGRGAGGRNEGLTAQIWQTALQDLVDVARVLLLRQTRQVECLIVLDNQSIPPNT